MGVWVGVVGMFWFKQFNANSMQMSCSLIQWFFFLNYIYTNCVCQILYGMIETHGLSAKSSMFCFLNRDTNENKQTDCNQIFLNHFIGPYFSSGKQTHDMEEYNFSQSSLEQVYM